MKGEPLNILLVEDNIAHAEMVKRSLEQHRVASIIGHVENGQDALDYVFNEGEYADEQAYPTPHCMLLDLRLPKVDGLEVLRRIKTDDYYKKMRKELGLPKTGLGTFYWINAAVIESLR